MLSKRGQRPGPLKQDDLRVLVEGALAADLYVGCVETIHARFDHQEREIDINDVLHGLEERWHGVGNPEFEKDHWQWKYPVQTFDVEGDPITVLVAVDTLNRSFEVVTRWRGH